MLNETILLMEDNMDVLSLNQQAFEQEGYAVLAAGTLHDARALFKEGSPDLAVLDIVMPDGSGLDFCEEIRRHASIPILFLTVKGKSEHIVNGLSLGANDYIVKPYETAELLARVKAQLSHQRRMRKALRGDVELEGLMLDMASRRAVYQGKDIILTPKEFSLLETLMRWPGQYIDSKELYQSIWGMHTNEDIRTLFVHVSTMRRKLKDAGAGHIRIDRYSEKGFRLRTASREGGDCV